MLYGRYNYGWWAHHPVGNPIYGSTQSRVGRTWLELPTDFVARAPRNVVLRLEPALGATKAVLLKAAKPTAERAIWASGNSGVQWDIYIYLFIYVK